MKQYPVKYVELSNGETIAYRNCGTGKQPLILVHGNMSSSVHLQPLMEQLEPYFTIYAPDLRGFGDSSYNKSFSTLGELADDLDEFMKYENVVKPVLLGWSTGGGVIMEMAAKPDADIRALILLSSVGLKGYPLLRKDTNLQPIEGDYLLTREEISIDPVAVLPALEAYQRNDRLFFRDLWNALIYHNAEPDSADYELYLDAILKQRNLVDVDYSLVHFNITDEDTPTESGSSHAKKISCPVAIVHGEADRVVPVESAKEAKVFFGAQAKLHILDNLSHSIITDDVKALAEIVMEFRS